MKNLFILITFLTSFIFTSTVIAQKQNFSVKSKRAIQLYKDADILATYNKDYARAVFTLRTLIKEKPEFVEAHLLLGDIYGKVKRYTSQKKSYMKVLALVPSDPRHVTMYYNLGLIYQQEQNYTEAIKFLQKIEDFPLASKTITNKAITLKQVCEAEILKQEERSLTLAQD